MCVPDDWLSDRKECSRGCSSVFSEALCLVIEGVCVPDDWLSDRKECSRGCSSVFSETLCLIEGVCVCSR